MVEKDAQILMQQFLYFFHPREWKKENYQSGGM